MDSTLDHDNATATMHSRAPYKRPRIRKSRGRGLRTTSGCTTCRKRHLKCDEVKPICGACEEKSSICEYTGSSRRSVEVLSSNADITEDVTEITTDQQQATSPADDNRKASERTHTDSNRLRYDPCEVAGSTWVGNETGLSPAAQLNQLASSQIPLAFPSYSLSPVNASFAAVQWFGLLASDAARDISQLSTVPHSWANESLSLGNSGPDDPTQLSSLQRATQVLDSPPTSNTSHDPTHTGVPGGSPLEEGQIWHSREPIELLPTESTLFEHFVTQVSPWIDLFDPTSQFSTFVAHLAIHNAGLMNAILALASRHLTLNPRLDSQDIPNKGEAALQYYYQTLHYVQRAMQYSGYKTSLELLATTLFISAYEMLDNSSNDWERHLEGVFLIQRSQVIHGESGGLHSAVWWAWLCQDIWAAFREKRKTLTFWVPQNPLATLSPHELALRSIYNTAKVISYCAEPPTEENILRAPDYEFSPLPLSTRKQSSSFRPIWIRPPAFAVAVQFFNVSRILLLAHEPSIGGLEEYLERQNIIKRCTEEICGIAMTLKDNSSSLMSSQALFIAGLFMQERSAREAVFDLLGSCREQTGRPIRSLGEELQQFWKAGEAAKPAASLMSPRRHRGT
ncbi:hypothetical protein N7492_009616 [Penicillium capsulatum]|uniref:Zn(2)-C6 fungal-type domain-containing protein n=1 Tax=Penicillium capsulatum TaxID=69766 RepID=A0A9W9HUB3_9EURO|nr:hypothetical protein N7492_009616 [Penicillium capsulatum]KAJ6107003.1 hypothetical protein N7512_010520 [Penicillium capsulatum]